MVWVWTRIKGYLLTNGACASLCVAALATLLATSEGGCLIPQLATLAEGCREVARTALLAWHGRIGGYCGVVWTEKLR